MRKLVFPCCHLAPLLSWWLQRSTTNKLPDETVKTSTTVLFLSNFLSNFSVRCFCLRKSSWTNSVMISNEPSPLPSYCAGTLVRGMSCFPDWKLKGWVTVGHLNGCPWRNTCWWNVSVVKRNMCLFNGLGENDGSNKITLRKLTEGAGNYFCLDAPLHVRTRGKRRTRKCQHEWKLRV